MPVRSILRPVTLVVVNATIVFVLALVAEGILRVTDTYFPRLRYGDRQQDLWVSDATKGWFHRPHFTTETFLGGPDRGHARINSLGLRSPEIARDKPPGTRRLLLVGDSYAFGVGVDAERIFPTLLEGALNDSRPERWEVVNLGVNSYSTDQELVLYRELAPELRPDVTILIVCDNDFEANVVDFVHMRYYKPYFRLHSDGSLTLHNVPVPEFTAWQKAKLWLGQRSRVWNAFRSRRSEIPWLQAGLDAFQVAVPMPPPNDEMDVTAAMIVSMRDLARRLGSRFLMINTAHRGERTTQMQELRRRLRPAGVRFMGLEEYLGNGRRDQPDGLWDFPGDLHWNIDAHAVVTSVVFNVLVSQGLLEPLDPAGAPAGEG